MSVEPDTKDWTWVLDRPCPECGYAADEVTVDRLPMSIRVNATGYERFLAGDEARLRPDAATWSPLEYACHVRDVHRMFAGRVRLMLSEDDPTFANWDQDATALEEGYADQDPAVVGGELLDAAEEVAELYESVPPDGWGRRGSRSNPSTGSGRRGSEFTIETLGRYHLHDVVHHLWDVGGPGWPYDDTVYEVDE